MSLITVYKFTIYNPKNDAHEIARGMASEKVISKIKGATVIHSESKKVDESTLSETLRYHECD